MTVRRKKWKKWKRRWCYNMFYSKKTNSRNIRGVGGIDIWSTPVWSLDPVFLFIYEYPQMGLITRTLTQRKTASPAASHLFASPVITHSQASAALALFSIFTHSDFSYPDWSSSCVTISTRVRGTRSPAASENCFLAVAPVTGEGGCIWQK